jgi:amino acid transporter
MHKPEPIPKHPIRNSVILYAAMAVTIVVIGTLTGSPLLPKSERDALEDFGTLPVAIVFFLVAMSYSWWRWRRRLAREHGQGP